TYRARDPERLHDRLSPAGSRRPVSPRARRDRASDPACRRPHAARLLRRAGGKIDAMTALRWIERGLLVVGIGLAVWCALVMLDLTRTQHMAPPPLTITQTLPGDEGSPHHPPSPGTWLARLQLPSVEMSTTVLEGS